MRDTIEVIKENPFHIPTFKIQNTDGASTLPSRQISNASTEGSVL